MNLCNFEDSCNTLSSPNDLKILMKQIKREVETLSKTTEVKLLKHDGKIAEMCKYIKDNLTNSLRCLIDSMKLSGELDTIIKDVLLDVSKNILVYGGDNTGFFDNSKIVKNLSENGVKEIFFPIGTYLFENEICLENVTLIGENKGGQEETTFIIKKPITLHNISNDGVKVIKNIKFKIDNAHVKDGLILGNGTWGCRYKIENCQFINFSYNAVKCLSNFSTEFKDCLFQDNGKETNIGVSLTSNDEPSETNFNNEIIINNCYFNNSHSTKNSTCIKADNVRGLKILNSSFEWSKCAIEIGRLAVNINVDTCWFEQLEYVFNKQFLLNSFKDCTVYTTNYLFNNETNINDGFYIPKIEGETLNEAMKNAENYIFPYKDRIRYSVNNKYHEVINEGYASSYDYRPKNKLKGTKLSKSIFYDTSKLKETGLKYLVVASARKTFDTNTSTSLAYGLVSKDFVIGLDQVVKNSNQSETSKILNIGFQADGVSLSLIDEVEPDFESCVFIPLSL